MVTRPEGTLLAVDVGNTNTVLGLYEGDRLLRHWRLTTRREATADEIVLSVRGLLEASGGRQAPREVIVASVVPSLKFPMRQALRQICGQEPLFVEPGVKTGMPILYEVPQEVGADRIVNAVAAHARLGGPCIVVDFGTATTFDVVTEKGRVRRRRHRARHRGLGRGALREGGAALARRDPPAGARHRENRRRPRSSPGSTSATSRWWTAWWIASRESSSPAARHRDGRARRALRRRIGAHR